MNKKALIRDYKEMRRPMGIYCVKNRISVKLLIGSSVDLPSMLNRQRSQLEMGGHVNRELQKDWNQLGASAFAFETLDTLKAPEKADYDPSADLQTLELLWLEKLSPYADRGYNPPPRTST